MKRYKIISLIVLLIIFLTSAWFVLSDDYYTFSTIDNVSLEDEYWINSGDKAEFEAVAEGAKISDLVNKNNLNGLMFVDYGATLHEIQSVIKIGSNLKSISYSLGPKSGPHDCILSSGGVLRSIWLLWVSSGLTEGSEPYPLVVYVNFVYPELDDDQALPELATVAEYCILIGEK